MKSSDLQARLRSLPTDPLPEDIEPIAQALAAVCAQRSQPLKSLALFRRNVESVASHQLITRLSDRVIDLLDGGVVQSPPERPTVSGEWLSIADAAAIQHLQRATLAERLKQWRYRCLYGWPHWDGHQWWFSSLAIDPATRAEYLARSPREEPAAHAAMLPAWCERGPTTDAGGGPA